MDEMTVNIVGNMVKDPEWSPNNKGGNFATCEVITNHSVYNKEIGQRVSTPQLHTINCKNQAAEYLMTYGAKGKRVYIKGLLLYREEIRGGMVSNRPYIEAQNIDIARNEGE